MLLSSPSRRPTAIRVAVTGANGGYGRTLLDQLRRLPDIRAVQLVDPDVAGTTRMLLDLGVGEDGLQAVDTAAQTGAAVDAGRVAVVADAAALDWSRIDVLVEATGRIDVGHAYADAAIEHDVHVVMVSKEVESVVGVHLATKAAARGLRYLPGAGDQPANLLRLVSWVSACGFDVVALGKSAEYDLAFDPETGIVDQNGEQIAAPALADLLVMGDDVQGLLADRASAVSGLRRGAAADACEMNVVSLWSGAGVDVETMHYPVVRPDELADVYAMREHGGIIDRSGSADVFSMLRLPGEASFAGGVFVIVRTGDATTWETLRGKGHVVSRDGRYACIYWPYHYMGIETPLSIAEAFDGTSTLPQPRQHTLLAARSTSVLPTGTGFRVAGHHHEIDGVAPVIVDPDDEGVAPYYLLSGARLTTDVEAGRLIRLDDLVDVPAAALDAYRAGAALAR